MSNQKVRRIAFSHSTATNNGKLDVVCMMHQNHPSFVVAFLAISKVGAVPALINHNLSDQPLLHCLQVTVSRLFLFDPVYTQQVATVADQARSSNMALYGYGEGHTDNFPMVTEDILASFSKEQPDDTCLHNVQPEDAAMLIYTRFVRHLCATIALILMHAIQVVQLVYQRYGSMML